MSNNGNVWQHISITGTADTTISPDLIDIGKASTNYFLGLLDDVRIYNYARTQEQIQQDYNQGFSAYFK